MYEDMGEGIVGLFKAMSILAIIGVAAIVIGIAAIILFAIQHVRIVFVG